MAVIPVAVLHALVTLDHLLLFLFALLGLAGNPVLNTGADWIIFFVILYVLDILETATAFAMIPLGSGKTQWLSRDHLFAVWHWMLDLFLGAVVLAVSMSTSIGTLYAIQWTCTLMVIIVSWLVESLAFLSL